MQKAWVPDDVFHETLFVSLNQAHKTFEFYPENQFLA